MFAPLFQVVAAVASAVSIAPIGAGDALTLPAQRHLVRMAPGGGRPPAYLLALQQAGQQSRGLGFFRSDDEGQTWRYYAPIQNDYRHFDRADLLPVGNDIALVYSYEGPTLSGSTAHDVYFQWWRYVSATHDWQPSTAVRVFDSTSASSAYSRAEIARDSLGRLWVLAFRLESDGGSTAVIAVSTNGGATFTELTPLDRLPARGGGRILSLGTTLLMVASCHGCAGPTRFRTRQDADPVNQWAAVQSAFPEGIYQGAALSAVADGAGGMHLFYKDYAERLFYRFFNGTAFGPATLLEPVTDWALQAAATRLGGDVVVFYNHLLSNETHDFRARTLRGGTFSSPVVLDSSATFKGYPASVELLPTSVAVVPCVFGLAPNASDPGTATEVALTWVPSGGDGGTPDAGPPDAGPPDAGPPDAGPPDAGPPDAGPSDAGPPDAGSPDAGPPGESLLFSDSFSRVVTSGLGPGWNVVSGLWYADGTRAISDLDGRDQATANVATCRDCRVESTVTGFGVPETGVFLRSPSALSPDRYDLVLLSNGRLRVRRVTGSTTTVLAEAPSGLTALNTPAILALSAVGANPVTLTASVNGITRLVATDSASALIGSGYAGLWTLNAGVVFDDFRLWSVGGGSAPDGGLPDAGSPDAGAPDAGAPDAGAPDAGAPDAGTQVDFEVTLTSASHRVLAVDPGGTAYGISFSDSSAWLYASTDNARGWSRRGMSPGGAAFRFMTSLADGTLLATTRSGGQTSLARSTDHGATWTNVLNLGAYEILGPPNIAELDGMTYLLEYQSFTVSSVPVRLWASANRGATWSVRATFSGHRHGHALAADPVRHALWAFFGDTTEQSGTYRSIDGGASWSLVLAGQEGSSTGGVVLPDGALLYGQDISYLPPRPKIVRLTPDGGLTILANLTGPSYSTHALQAGGFVVGAAREPGGDIYPPGEVSAHVYASADGVTWAERLRYPRLSETENTLANVFWELPSGELVLQLENVQLLAPGGQGYQLLRVIRR